MDQAATEIRLHQDDLPGDLDLGREVAVDTEAMGLVPGRDRLCLVQLSAGDGVCHLVQFRARRYDAPNLRRLLEDEAVLKIFHFGRFDIAMLRHHLGVLARPVYCTKIASRLARTFTDRHGLRDLCRDILGVEIAKTQQMSDWGAEELAENQLRYAAGDVVHLHAIRARLDAMLLREGRMELARACFAFLPRRAELDLAGFAEPDLFAH